MEIVVKKSHRRKKKRLRQKRTRAKIEDTVERYLTDLNLRYEAGKHIGKYSVDFLVEGKLIVECYGNFWHCNPKKYPPKFYNKGLKCEAHRKWEKDLRRQRILENMGYRFLVLWETDIKFCPHYCKTLIKFNLHYPESTFEKNTITIDFPISDSLYTHRTAIQA